MRIKNMIAVLSALSVSAMGLSAMTFSASAAEEMGKAYFIGALGAEQNWNADTAYQVTSIDGDAQYEVEWCPSAGGTSTVEFLAVCISPSGATENFTTDTFPDLAVTLDEVWIDGVQLADYTVSDAAINTAYYESDAGVTRIYLHDDWAGTKVADLPSATTITQSVKVVFTVSGLGVEGTSNVVTDEETTPSDTTDDTTSSDTTEDTASSEEDNTNDGADDTQDATENNDADTDSSAADDTTSKNDTTSSNNAGGSTNANQTTTNTNTGDAGVAGLVAAMAVAGAVAVVAKKKN